MVDYAAEPLKKYADDLAAKQETPGGGSVSGLVGALAAGLGSMVCNFTIGKKKYADVEQEVKRILEQCEALRGDLLKLMQQDVDVFQGQMGAAYGMPKDTPEQAAARKEAIQSACKAATQPPLTIARRCFGLLKLLVKLGQKGSVLLVSDVGVALALSGAAFDSAALNVQINLNYIDDSKFVEQVGIELDALAEQVPGLVSEGMSIVQAKMEKK